MMFNPELKWEDLQEEIESIDNLLDEDGKYLGYTPEEIMAMPPQEYVFDIMTPEDTDE